MTYYVSCDYDWQDGDEFDDEKSFRDWMIEHYGESLMALGPGLLKAKGHDSFRVWELVGEATVVIKKTEQVLVKPVRVKKKGVK